MSAEQWKDIPGHEGKYQASDLGRIRSLPRRRTPGKVLVQNRTKAGHCRVHLGRDFRDTSVHRVILETFFGPCPDGMEGCHKNGDPGDNRISNLRWDSRKGNHADKIIHGTSLHGSVNPKAKLRESDIPMIRSMSKSGVPGKHIAKRFGVTAANISSILKGKTWNHIA